MIIVCCSYLPRPSATDIAGTRDLLSGVSRIAPVMRGVLGHGTGCSLPGALRAATHSAKRNSQLTGEGGRILVVVRAPTVRDSMMECCPPTVCSGRKRTVAAVDRAMPSGLRRHVPPVRLTPTLRPAANRCVSGSPVLSPDQRLAGHMRQPFWQLPRFSRPAKLRLVASTGAGSNPVAHHTRRDHLSVELPLEWFLFSVPSLENARVVPLKTEVRIARSLNTP